MKAIGIDVGGTFTDFILFDSDTRGTWVHKRSTGGDPARAVVEGVAETCEIAGVMPEDLGLVIHGTTVATNAVLEYDGARVGMLTTKGFRDVTHIGRHQRPLNYSIQQDIPWQSRPLVRRRHRKGVRERLIPPSGEVLTPLDEDEVRRAAGELRDAHVESVAVCFLFSYLNPAHESRAAEIVREAMPGAFVCTSHEVIPQFREFERFTTTAINAFVGPKVRSYVETIEGGLRKVGVRVPLKIMQSNGGTATPEVAKQRPVTLLLSGPVGGVMAGAWLAQGKHPYVATLDVGGTSADIGIVVTDKGLVEARSRDTWIAGYPVSVPMVDIETIGAGGGSIAHVDAADALHVGPASAGAVPGPACYGNGGNRPTVTDANVVLGRLPAALAGGLRLDAEASNRVLGELAADLGLSTLAAAAGVIRVVNENMAAALRSRTVERGLDPRRFVLCAFGGGGPLQAAEIARILGIPKVLIPPSPGVTSAAGLLRSDLRYDVSQSYLGALGQIDADALAERYRSAESDLRERLHADGCDDDRIRIERGADLRYQGQSFELNIEIPDSPMTGETIDHLRKAFHEAHKAEFGHDLPDFEVEFVNVRVTGTGALPHLEHKHLSDGSFAEPRVSETDTAFDIDGEIRRIPTPILARERIAVGARIAGPAVVVQLDSTTLIPPGCTAVRDEIDNILIEIG